MKGDQQFVNAVLWRVKTGAPWRDLPERYGPWKTVYNRLGRWATRGVWEGLCKALQLQLDDVCSLLMPPSSGRIRTPRVQKGGRCNALGRSRGGFSSKVHALRTTQGQPLEVTLCCRAPLLMVR